MFQTRLNSALSDESAGFDNIRITAKFECGCNPSKVVQPKITFENGSTSGFTNGIIDYDPGFTKFLGRYGKNNAGPGKDPFRYFSNIPKDADHVILEFDFYEIDSWDYSHKDYLCVAIDHRTADLGRFDTHQNENGRSRSPGGIYFKIVSQAPPRNIGFNDRWKDQIHHITMKIPNRFFKNDGRIKVVFMPRLNEPDINNESAGFDNIMLTAKFDCDRRMLRGDSGEEVVDEDDEEELRLWELKDAENFVEEAEEPDQSGELVHSEGGEETASHREDSVHSYGEELAEVIDRIGTDVLETARHFLRG